jgi:cell division septal protein FtsQ
MNRVRTATSQRLPTRVVLSRRPPTPSLTARPTRRRSVTRLGATKKRHAGSTRALEIIPLVRSLRVDGVWDGQKIASLLVLLTLSWALWQCFTAPDFVVESAAVLGNKGLATADILGAARASQGRNVFLLNGAEILQAVKKLPGIKEVQIRLEVPNRLIVEVQDQVAQIVWQTLGSPYLVASDGEIIRQGNGSGHYLTIVETNPQAEPLDKRKRVDAGAISTVLQLDGLMAGQIKQYEWGAGTGVVIVSTEGWRADVGSDDNLQAKVSVIRAAAQRAKQNKEPLTFMDVRNPELASVR